MKLSEEGLRQRLKILIDKDLKSAIKRELKKRTCQRIKSIYEDDV